MIQCTPLEWKIGTGASNALTEDVYYSTLLQERLVLERVRKHFQTADGATLNIAETTKMSISLGPVNVKVRIFVERVNCNLLGQYLMTKISVIGTIHKHIVVNCVHTRKKNDAMLPGGFN